MTLRTTSVGALFVAVACYAPAAAQTGSYELQSAEVMGVHAEKLIVLQAEGAREFTIPPSSEFDVDGKTLGLADLKPGMKVTARITPVEPPVELVVTVLNDVQVYFTAGTSLIVKDVTGEQFRRFTGRDAKDMEILISTLGHVVPPTGLAMSAQFSGFVVSRFPPKSISAEDAAEVVRLERQKPVPVRSIANMPRITRVVPGPTAPPAASSAEQAESNPPATAPAAPTASPAPKAPKTLPKTASDLPLVGVAGLVCLGLGMASTLRRALVAARS